MRRRFGGSTPRSTALEKSDVEILNFVRYREILAWFLVPALVLLLLEMVLSNTSFRKLP